MLKLDKINNMSFFTVEKQDKKTQARAGIIKTDHGDILTPVFMPVGTQASVKSLDSADLENIGAQIILGNTYHLHLRPGEDLIAKLGGLHEFMNWDKPILTDSGGFQVFSLGKSRYTDTHPDIQIPPTSVNLDSSVNPDFNQVGLVKIDEDGVTFRSHIDGSPHRFTPEIAVQIQRKLGADIIMAFDECTPDKADKKYVEAAMERTHRWAERSLAEHKKLSKKGAKKTHHRFLFGIAQGAGYKDLRVKSAKFISSLDFDGIALGGESIGYNMEATKKILNWIAPIAPKDKPLYTMGLGLDPADLLEAVEGGADMFDCVAPTRLARHGVVFVRGLPKNRLNLKISSCAKDKNPIDKKCGCSTCQNYTRAYLHHLFAAEELSGLRLATIHNLHFMLNLMRGAREAILEDKFSEFKNAFTKK